jgi:hypothetical protein
LSRALAGLCFAVGLNKGIDITGWINNLLNVALLPFNKIIELGVLLRYVKLVLLN